MRILTQKQAAKQFPEHGYEDYEPMLLVVGKRKEFQKIKVDTILTVNGRRIATETGYSPFGPDLMQEPEGTQFDVEKPKDTRLVIWK